uniref:Calcitonin peptide-like domain-containing protein n=1 Tax=Periophthalmus magnuspinnatus TaxID=409849 RepID=A0A3B4A8H2_9GOBI
KSHFKIKTFRNSRILKIIRNILFSARFVSRVGQTSSSTSLFHSHSLQKRKCNTATCVTQRLADFLVRSSNTIGTVYAPTNVGSAAYGKRSALSPPVFMPL